MAQAKKKQATKTAKKTTTCRKTASKKRLCYEKYNRDEQPNAVFVVAMSVLAATLLFADLLMMTA